MTVNHVIVANFYIANMCFNTICENKIFAKISEFTIRGQKHKVLLYIFLIRLQENFR